MDFLYDFVKTYWYYFVIGLLSLLLAGVTTYLFLKNEDVSINECEEKVVYVEEVTTDKIFVDVKGAVNSPGVYEMDSISIINDVIKEAGGFTKGAYTNNINLSKKLINEMVVYVYTKTEYKKLNVEKVVETPSCTTNSYDIGSCVDSGSSVITPSSSNTESAEEEKTIETKEDLSDSETKIEENAKISINTATKEELMKLDGIGESKAENIIKYREENGSFKTIEDIKNVSGIGDAAYAKIKDSITI